MIIHNLKDIAGIGNYEDWTNYVKDGSEDILEIFQYALVVRILFSFFLNYYSIIS